MSDYAAASENLAPDEYFEDEFGIGLKGYLLARFIFSALSLFMVLGALVCVFTGLTSLDVLISSATGLTPTKVDLNFTGYQICMYVQAAYSVLSPFVVLMFIIKKNKLFAFIDLGLFLVFFIIAMIMGGPSLFFNGFSTTAWVFYIFLNPVWSFAALFLGKHFKYMPFK